MSSRVVGAVMHPVRTATRLRLRSKSRFFALVNRFSRRSVLGDGDAIVSMTSFAHRLDTVHITLESIARGSVRPRRVVLWVADANFVKNPPPQLVRLQKRGLELLETSDFGPHKKQYPIARSKTYHELPVVVADDDVFYPNGWLQGLLAAHHEDPTTVHGYRAHRLVLDKDSKLAPYAQWVPAPSNKPSFAIMATGVGGIIYPTGLLDALREEGEGFLTVAPRADDVWVHVVSVRAGIRTSQIPSERRDLDAVPGTQRNTLQGVNVKGGGNDVQIAQSYGPHEICLITKDAKALR